MDWFLNPAAGAFKTAYRFDLNGNIETLTGNGKSGSIDQLTYDYSGNQLQTVEDLIAEAEGFINGHSGTLANPDYHYDANGNMKVAPPSSAFATRMSEKGICNAPLYFIMFIMRFCTVQKDVIRKPVWRI